MPAITLGLAEIEERLRALRRRLNSVAAQHSAYVGTSAILLVSTALVILGLHGPALAFRVATWGGALVLVAAGAGAALWLRRRWLDVTAAAHVADRRGQLSDRLTTLCDLRLRPRPSRLAPVLVAQALALGDQWEVPRIVPRRVPRSVFMLVASMALLAATTLIARRTPSQPREGGGQGAATASLQESVSQTARRPDAPMSSVARVPAAHEWQPSIEPAATDLPASRTGSSQPSASSGQPGSRLAALPDQLRQAIRRAFRAEATHPARQLAARSDGGNRMSAEGRGGRRPDPSGTRGRKQEALQRPRAGEKGIGGRDHTQAARRQAGRQVAGQRHLTAPKQNFEGSSPPAGHGSSPGRVFGPEGEGSAGAAEGPATFKLTITSFLHAVQQKERQVQRRGRGVSSSSAPGVGGAETALSDRQLQDDALRKAEIPPAYEDMIRQVYSSRAVR